MSTRFVTDYPEVAVLTITSLIMALVAFIGWWMRIIRAKLVDHVRKEEEVTWPEFRETMQNLKDQIAGNHLESIKSIGSLDKRLSIIEVSNGEIRDLKIAVIRLSKQLSSMDKS